MINGIVALKIWGPLWENRNIVIKCNNLPAVEVLTTGRARDQILATSARNVWFLTAIYNIHLCVQHIGGKDNNVVNLLSRWFTTPNNEEKC